MLVDQARRRAHNVLALPVAEEAERLERVGDVVGRDVGQLGEARQRERAARGRQRLQQLPRPEAAVAQLAEVRQGLLGRPKLALPRRVWGQCVNPQTQTLDTKTHTHAHTSRRESS